jgi:hypothetical protein
VNAKVRDDLFDVKTLESTRDGFERWSPGNKATFPLSAAWLRAEILPLWQLESPRLLRLDYTSQQLIDEVVDPHPELAAMPVQKLRHAFTLDGCIAEVADVAIGSRALQTAAIESADLDALRASVERTGLTTATNTSYPKIIRETLGWGRA